MTLNFRPYSVFPVNSPENTFVTSLDNIDGFSKPQCFGCGVEEPYVYHREEFYGRNHISFDQVEDDVINLLPSDPFEMGLNTAFTAITGWFDDVCLEANTSKPRDHQKDYEIFELNIYCNGSVIVQQEPIDLAEGERLGTSGRFDIWADNEWEEETCDVEFSSYVDVDEFLSTSGDENLVSDSQAEEVIMEETNEFCDGKAPHEALFYALSYLCLSDLLSVEMVCQSLHDTVKNDSFLWRNIHVDPPLNDKITDDVLLNLSGRAQGILQSLSLTDCSRITDDGLRPVLLCNPKLSKLSVAGCMKLSVEATVNCLKARKNLGFPRLQQLRIGNIFGMTYEHFTDLQSLLEMDNTFQQPKPLKPRFYHMNPSPFSFDDERVLDIEMCSKCENLRLIYDCPAENCQGKFLPDQICRACTFCIARCFHCGKCINDEYEETFFLELCCSNCYRKTPEDKGESSNAFC